MLPLLSDRWVSALLPSPLPEERKATCDACVMLPHPGEAPDRDAVTFTVKCCTYQPWMHNFLAGGVLLDAHADALRGRGVIERLIKARDGVSALGVRTAEWRLKVGREKPDTFGRSRALLCPHYQEEAGACGVWRHREATCSTWFCKHERGAVGLRFWDALRLLLECLEQALARHCALELELGAEALEALSSSTRGPDFAELFGPPTDAVWRQRWGRWAGREREFFQRCAAVAAAVSPEQVLALGGSQARLLLELARTALERHHDPGLSLVPLRVGRVRLVRGAPGSVRLETYRAYDPIELPQPLFAALARFDGRPTPEVVEEIAARDGFALGPELLRTLGDYEVLVPADGG